MTNTLQGLRAGEVKLLFGIIEKLAANHDQAPSIRISASQSSSPLLSGMKIGKHLPSRRRSDNGKREVGEGDKGFCC
jgi:hypothetical protein